ncbi:MULTISPECIES: hypothetical protein [Giesbergeria]
MPHSSEDLKIIGKVLGKKVDLPVARPAGWHNPRWREKTSIGRIPEHLRPGFRTYPQIIKDAVSNFLSALYRNTLGRLRCNS